MCILNRKAVKELALAVSKTQRSGRFTRVSAEFVERIEAMTRRMIEREIREQPSLGVTLK